MNVLDVESLTVGLKTPAGLLQAVRGISFSIGKGETFGLVGESGSGKTMTALALLNLMPRNGVRQAARLALNGADISDETRLQRVRGSAAAMIFQEPMTALNPVLPVGAQMIEGLLMHQPGTSREAARARACELLARCGIASPEARLRQYPHELSGGMRQRVMIAMALMTSPSLLIADEPTTALDVTIQSQIIALLSELRRELDLAILFITHDLTLIKNFAHRVGVMYAGGIVETGPAARVISRPAHPYTQRLAACAPSLAAKRGEALDFLPGLPPLLTGALSGCQFRFRCALAEDRCAGEIPLRQADEGHSFACIHGRPESIPAAAVTASAPPEGGRRGALEPPLLKAENINVEYSIRGGFLRRAAPVTAVRGASLEIPRGVVLGLVGESGSGKSTLARIIIGLEKPKSGSVVLAGKPHEALTRLERARIVQPVFQDPYSSLNPRRKVIDIVSAPLEILGLGNGAERARTASRTLDRCGIAARLFESYPSQLSGGQRQRVAIARALVSNPALVVCDEPTSALDVSIQSQILNLLEELKRDLKLTYLFISHNLAVVRHLADRVAVMRNGEIVEQGEAGEIFSNPAHEYTRALLVSAVQPGRAPEHQPMKRIPVHGKDDAQIKRLERPI